MYYKYFSKVWFKVTESYGMTHHSSMRVIMPFCPTSEHYLNIRQKLSSSITNHLFQIMAPCQPNTFWTFCHRFSSFHSGFLFSPFWICFWEKKWLEAIKSGEEKVHLNSIFIHARVATLSRGKSKMVKKWSQFIIVPFILPYFL